MHNPRINKKIFALWEKYYKKDTKVLAPIFYDSFKQGGLLFIGMNPSFNPRGMHAVARKTGQTITNPHITHKWSYFEEHPERINESIFWGRHVQSAYPFFKRMHFLAEACGTFFQHIDLFVYRETQQNSFLKRVRHSDGTLNTFGSDQFDIFLLALTMIEPACIIVSNAGASDILRTHFKDALTFDQQRGHHMLTLAGKTTPIFFSSMLSGQRALDTGSFERLVWHVRQAVM